MQYERSLGGNGALYTLPQSKAAVKVCESDKRDLTEQMMMLATNGGSPRMNARASILL
jgi:hypothetical protein